MLIGFNMVVESSDNNYFKALFKNKNKIKILPEVSSLRTLLKTF